MRRRQFIVGAGTAGGVGLAGCTGFVGGGDPSGTLTVATYSSFTGEGAAGNWLKSAFEEENPDTTVEFVTPENGLNQYVQRAQQDAPIDADLYVGLNTGELVRADERLDSALFTSVESGLEGASEVKESLRIDPNGRAITYDTGYITLVYDEDEVEGPFTFDTLLEPAFENALITQNAQQSDPGRAFLLWTIANRGEDAYLDYWQGLLDNGVTVLDDWEPAYNAYLDGEAPMVVSYSTDQVFADMEGQDLDRHQIRFLNDQAYANPEGMAVFAEADEPDLAREFMSFMLEPEVQGEIAQRNVAFPAVGDAELPSDYAELAQEPADPVTFTYDELQGSVDAWVEAWERQFAGN